MDRHILRHTVCPSIDGSFAHEKVAFGHIASGSTTFFEKAFSWVVEQRLLGIMNLGNSLLQSK